jgi:antitoxin ParD1/3/4
MQQSSLNISLPKSLREYVESRVGESGYSTPSEYLRALIREDRDRRMSDKLERLLLEGIASGEPAEVDANFWKEKRRGLATAMRRVKRR